MLDFINKKIQKILGVSLTTELVLDKHLFSFSFIGKRPKPLIISSLDGKFFNNGLADRLKGMVSSYAYAKYNKLQFRITHKNPFDLELYLSPNKYNWILQKEELCNNLLYSNAVAIIDSLNKFRLSTLIRSRQHWFYTNIDFIDYLNEKYKKNFTYSQLYQELFKPSAYLQSHLDTFKDKIETGYISISFRFMQLMGDFKDIRGITLSETEQKTLIGQCIIIIKRIHEENKHIPLVLVTSDSQKFIQELSDLNYVFTLPGEIGHIGHNNNEAIMLKTFLDYYMISYAKKVYMVYNDQMYKSQFAKYAAQISDTTYIELKF